jgi:hypothetical protein
MLERTRESVIVGRHIDGFQECIQVTQQTLVGKRSVGGGRRGDMRLGSRGRADRIGWDYHQTGPVIA